MDRQKLEYFFSANEELRDFMCRVDNLVKGTGEINEWDLKSLSRRLAILAPEVGKASRSDTRDSDQPKEVAEYIRNLRALQTTLEKVRCIMLARKAQIETQRRHLGGLRGWVKAYHQTI